MGLKNKLYQTIKQQGELSYANLCQLVAEEGYKLETATRELRRLMSAENSKIKAVWATSKRGTKYIKAYRWLEPVAREQVKLI